MDTKKYLDEILYFLKKLFWLFLIIMIVFNIVIFHFFNGFSYLLWLVLGNIFMFYISIFVLFFIGRIFLINKAQTIKEEVIEEITKEGEEFIDKKIDGIDIQDAKIEK